ncbi:RNaseH domain-containing protein [Streptomyces albogriseolus]|uniref:RNaseH domain-containing protein n=1 Tax=Streptomyces albogriseolus TaxID=1887 RepID=UPI0036FE903B
MCNRPQAWSNRTRYPVHLHAAQQMDLDHPQYRRHRPPPRRTTRRKRPPARSSSATLAEARHPIVGMPA